MSSFERKYIDRLPKVFIVFPMTLSAVALSVIEALKCRYGIKNADRTPRSATDRCF
ncbi:MAG: hypothetical protein LBB48_02345 [Treponema sp.]|nr:hypothetical protein [Treponema sp.]